METNRKGGNMICIILKILSVVIVFVIIWCFFLLYRNNWVAKTRIILLWENRELYDKLPSYDEMLYRKFWIFDINKFLT